MSATENDETMDKAAAIRSEIDETRAGMSRTVEALAERLTPARLKEQAGDLKDSAVSKAKEGVGERVKHANAAVRDATVGKVGHMAHDVRETAMGAGTSVLQSVKQNPIPTAMIALGLGWLFINRQGDGRIARAGAVVRERGGHLMEGAHEAVETAGHKMSDAAHGAGERVEELSERARQTGADLSERARQTGADVSERARRTGAELSERARQTGADLSEGARRTREQAVERAQIGAHRLESTVQNALRENPLAVGALAFAIGTAAGLMLPRTRREDEWMGTKKDKLLSRAEGAARSAIDTVENKVGALTGGATQEHEEPRAQASAGEELETPGGEATAGMATEAVEPSAPASETSVDEAASATPEQPLEAAGEEATEEEELEAAGEEETEEEEELETAGEEETEEIEAPRRPRRARRPRPHV